MVDLRIRRTEGIRAAAWRQKGVRSPSKVNPVRLLLVCGILTFCLLLSVLFLAKVEEPSTPTPAVSNEQRLRKATKTNFLDFLVELARLPTSDLRRRLYDEDIFQRAELEGSCPFASPPPWLPPTPPKRDSTGLVWYEHVSKAGGTSFCQLAQVNMRKEEVPPYYCMPRDGDMQDGRVGRWSNEKLLQYRTEHAPIRIVSNEWQPFPPERRDLKHLLFFVTTLRDPLDRILSAYHFWGILHNQEKVKPSLAEWIERKRNRSNTKSPQDLGIAIHIGRYNFIAWKFSNGTMPQSQLTIVDGEMPLGVAKEEEDLWRKPFVMAAETLANFDLVLILELMSSHSSQMLTRTLGWTHLEKNHVVPSGKVENNHAAAALSKDIYDSLWEANRFDMILYHWMKAVHLARSQCP